MKKGFFTDLPDIQTERLLLRKIKAKDVNDIYEYASDPLVSQYVLWSTHVNKKSSKEFIAYVKSRYNADAPADWAIVDKANGKVIGTAGYVSWLPLHKTGQLGYVLNRDYWGRGLMSETVSAIIDYSYINTDINRIEARCVIENQGSARVMEKSGMKYEGILRKSMVIKGKIVDMKIYSIIRDEWNKK